MRSIDSGLEKRLGCKVAEGRDQAAACAGGRAMTGCVDWEICYDSESTPDGQVAVFVQDDEQALRKIYYVDRAKGGVSEDLIL